MGCNTSKESMTNVDEKDDIRIALDEKSSLRGDPNCNQEKLPQLAQSLSNDLNKGSVNKETTESSGPSKTINKPEPPEVKKAVLKKQKSQVEGLDEAATKIQAAFRGHKTRQSMKQADKPEKNAEATEDLANEFRPDDPELSNAATKIQASFRGHMARKKIAGKDNGEDEEKVEDQTAKEVKQEEEEFDIDLADPELNKAATKIQATFRTHMKHKDE